MSPLRAYALCWRIKNHFRVLDAFKGEKSNFPMLSQWGHMESFAPLRFAQNWTKTPNSDLYMSQGIDSAIRRHAPFMSHKSVAPAAGTQG